MWYVGQKNVEDVGHFRARCHLLSGKIKAWLWISHPGDTHLPPDCVLVSVPTVDCKRARPSRCPATCSCTKDHALCERARMIPRSFPPDVVSLSFVKSEFAEIPKESFIHTPALHLLLFTANTFDLINEDAFLGLSHLEYLFIENNQIKAISLYAFRGLKTLVHL
ncbi:hypothetical protein DPEC_G00040020 [Dallia pectoralis]|uniref:Uncharacterized protein n=1 Tax=Dallia pectoralis TaxID=75939 RepID=A0ACC2HEP7_DALPE|nr:hypothetical protein DPEC_G00040020 [Dallia pectoralis]